MEYADFKGYLNFNNTFDKTIVITYFANSIQSIAGLFEMQE